MGFPDEPRRDAGFQLSKVQAGLEPDCFQKKTQTTSKQDKDIAEARYRAVVNARKVKK
ncbi:MAG: phage-related protein [Rhodoferax sp.]